MLVTSKKPNNLHYTRMCVNVCDMSALHIGFCFSAGRSTLFSILLTPCTSLFTPTTRSLSCFQGHAICTVVLVFLCTSVTLRHGKFVEPWRCVDRYSDCCFNYTNNRSGTRSLDDRTKKLIGEVKNLEYKVESQKKRVSRNFILFKLFKKEV